MKQIIHFLAAFSFTFLGLSALMAQTQRVVFSPEMPKPGEKVTMTYDPAGSPLAGQKTIEMTAYFFNTDYDKPEAMEIPAHFDGKKWTGKFEMGLDTRAVLIGLADETGELTDNNDEKGFKTLAYNADRSNPVKGAFLTKSILYGTWGTLAGIKRDNDKAWELMNKEFEMNPELKADMKAQVWYASLSGRMKDEKGVADAKATAAALVAKKKATEDELLHAQTLANLVKDADQATAIGERLKKDYPKGKVVKNELLNSFNKAKDLEEKLAIYEKTKKNYGKDKDIQQSLDRFASAIAGAYAEKEDWANFNKYLGMVTNKTMKAGALNNVAWTLSGESLEGEGKNLKEAEGYSAMSLQLLKEEMENPANKPTFQTPKKYASNLVFQHAMFADTYALLLFKNGKTAEALKYQQIACDMNKFKDGETNERYMVYFEKEKGGKETEKLLAKFISEGNATSKMKEQHKRLFLAQNDLESAYDKYMVSLEVLAIEKMKEHLREQILDQPAPDFKLVNLKGEEVSLESLKGKVVVVDFWATWCGPCKASFPGMQKAVNKYADIKDVEFLFLDTWENEGDKAKNAADFIASKNYTFNVLMDDKSEVVTKFGVTGIPTKFVVDKNGIIRFKAVGFNGNDDELVKELSLMIEMAGGTSPSLTGTP